MRGLVWARFPFAWCAWLGLVCGMMLSTQSDHGSCHALIDTDSCHVPSFARPPLQAKMMQLQKVCNHPKGIVLTIDRDREAAVAKHTAASGSLFIQLPPRDSSHLSPEAREREDELRGLSGESLVASSGKLALLNRLLTRAKAAGERVLIFSQFTITLNVLEEYMGWRWGTLGAAYFRLDGSTNRIAREMDLRSFNALGSKAFVYLISTRSGGQGINLATANIVVLYDTCYNPQVDHPARIPCNPTPPQTAPPHPTQPPTTPPTAPHLTASTPPSEG